MNNLMINSFTASVGVVGSVVENTPLPMVVYVVFLAIAEMYKYKRSKNEQK
ncbi:hypothetical protein [Tenacibaculum ovolyticum]|uniref:hypothetical protein n=1 Tax=Tenacibaculum ovolyticum TaxID=104270 RepID=UPI003BAD914A